MEVRDGAHMFWWLYYADSQSAEYKDLPLVMWLQVRLGQVHSFVLTTVFQRSSVCSLLGLIIIILYYQFVYMLKRIQNVFVPNLQDAPWSHALECMI